MGLHTWGRRCPPGGGARAPGVPSTTPCRAHSSVFVLRGVAGCPPAFLRSSSYSPKPNHTHRNHGATTAACQGCLCLCSHYRLHRLQRSSNSHTNHQHATRRRAPPSGGSAQTQTRPRIPRVHHMLHRKHVDAPTARLHRHPFRPHTHQTKHNMRWWFHVQAAATTHTGSGCIAGRPHHLPQHAGPSHHSQCVNAGQHAPPANKLVVAALSAAPPHRLLCCVGTTRPQPPGSIQTAIPPRRLALLPGLTKSRQNRLMPREAQMKHDRTQ